MTIQATRNDATRSAAARWLTVVGLGEDGLDGLGPVARTAIARAELLVGGARHLALVAGTPGGAERLTWQSPLVRTMDAIAASRGRRVVVLASGDPMCFGIGVTLCRRFAREEMEILPGLSAFTLAAARLGWPLAETEQLTLHGRQLSLLQPFVSPGVRLLILSEDGDTPSRVAGLLRERGFGPSPMTALEALGGPRENRVDGTAEGWGWHRVDDLNTLAITCLPGPGARILPRAPGLPDEVFEHDGQLTKREVRAATLAALMPLPGQHLWDLGAGSGAIAIEWIRAARNATAEAVERRSDRAAVIARNAAALGTPRLAVLEGEALEGLPNLHPPDAVFVGGGLGRHDEAQGKDGLLDACWAALRPGGRLVANAVTLEGEATLLAWAAANPGAALSRIAVSRAAPVGRRLAWRPMMPVTQLAATKA